MNTATSEQTQAPAGTTVWEIDSAHSNVEFSVRHMMISTVKGQFQEVEGTIWWDEQDPVNSRVSARIDSKSITTFNEQRDQHLLTDDFFGADKWSDLVFESNRIEQVDDNRYNIHGDLTIRDVTKPVVLDTELEGIMDKDAFGNRRAAFTATTKINRKDFGVNWNGVIESGGVVVGDDVNITLHVALVQRVD